MVIYSVGPLSVAGGVRPATAATTISALGLAVAAQREQGNTTYRILHGATNWPATALTTAITLQKFPQQKSRHPGLCFVPHKFIVKIGTEYIAIAGIEEAGQVILKSTLRAPVLGQYYLHHDPWVSEGRS